MSDSPDTPADLPSEPPAEKAVAGKSHGRLKVQVTLQPRDLMEEPRRVKGAWEARIVTLFPEAFPGVLGLSLTGK
ncbi:MAG: tRNA ((37)-N1)-methyltransferase TrmD, partial [Pseudomonadota bacterium]